ncbi:hypothetical protein [Novosphingobium sp. SG707]|uniref:hypothetical protein n=1 Tax=Novosphingobium sp. SG707 TaxID=2586996 RepID=UPI0017E725DB|nr:hypothetical protein [Novosphingobium sp. SG707]NKI99626.1 hypothetical protein [Novosphingobium sp. SG707]
MADGHDEQSFALHGVLGFGRAEYSCRNAVAQPFQWWDDSFELFACVPRHVLAEDKISPAFIGDAADFGREEAGAACAGTLSGNAVVLARIARSDDIHEAAPWSAVESGKVRPDRRRMKPPRFH